MKKWGYAFLLTLLITVGAAGVTLQEADRNWVLKNTLTGDVTRSAYEMYKAVTLEQPSSYEAFWKYSRALYWYGMNIAKDNKTKKEIFSLAKEAGMTATQLKPEGSDGHVWLGVSWGAWGEANGILNSLKVVPEIEKNMNEVLTKDPLMDEAIAYRVLGRLYFKAPGPPLSIGDKDKAEQYLRKAVEIAPRNKKNIYFLADVLSSKKNYKEALEVLNKGLAQPVRPEAKTEELEDIDSMKELKKRIEERE